MESTSIKGTILVHLCNIVPITVTRSFTRTRSFTGEYVLTLKGFADNGEFWKRKVNCRDQIVPSLASSNSYPMWL